MLAVLGILVGILFLANLSSGSLWQDEAQTALIARTVLEVGRWNSAYSGRRHADSDESRRDDAS